LKAFVVVHVLLNLRGLVGWDSLREHLTPHKSLKQEKRALVNGLAADVFREHLAAQGTTAKTVDGLHLAKDILALLLKLSMHVHIASL
jgi:hypothetical protein